MLTNIVRLDSLTSFLRNYSLNKRSSFCGPFQHKLLTTRPCKANQEQLTTGQISWYRPIVVGVGIVGSGETLDERRKDRSQGSSRRRNGVSGKLVFLREPSEIGEWEEEANSHITECCEYF